MDTKRCHYCHKVQRADAPVCSRCGQPFVRKKSRLSIKTFSQPSIPSASPHRAGHYSGLHPEDQPYQSSKIAIQRRSVQQPQQEPEQIILAASATQSDLTIHQKVTARDKKPLPTPTPYKPRKLGLPPKAIPIILTVSCLLFLLASSILTLAIINNHTSAVATATLRADPDVLRTNDTFTLIGSGFNAHNLITFTYDANKTILDGTGKALETDTDGRGNFSIQLRLPSTWTVGQHLIHAIDDAQQLSLTTSIVVQQPPVAQPSLQVSTTTVNIGSGTNTTITNQTITLINTGGGQIVWQGSSDQAWLTITPKAGTFSGRQSVQLAINRSNLAPQSYTGHITFTQQGASTPPQILTVTMAVNPVNPVTPTPSTPPIPPTSLALNISTTALTYTTNPSQNPASQAMTIQNSGNQPFDWTSSFTAGNNSSWLSITPANGHLEAGTSAVITVSLSTQQLKQGAYQGILTFAAGNLTQQVAVSLTIKAPPSPAISVLPTQLTVNAFKGINPTTQTVAVTNPGNAALNWIATVDGSGASSISVTPSQGILAAGQSTNITVSLSARSANVGTLTATITLADKTAGSTVQSQSVPIVISIRDQADITLSQSTLTFNNTSSFTYTGELVVIGNDGSTDLNWSVAQPTSSAVPWLSFDTPSGTVSSGTSAALGVYCDSKNLSPGTYNATLIISDSDTGTEVAPQTIHITLIVQ